MEQLHYRSSAGHARSEGHACVVGVVGSGNLEVLIEPASLDGQCTVDINTPVRGFATVWQAVVADFFQRHALGDVRLSVNDNGATPATVALRLDQAVEEFLNCSRDVAA